MYWFISGNALRRHSPSLTEPWVVLTNPHSVALSEIGCLKEPEKTYGDDHHSSGFKCQVLRLFFGRHFQPDPSFTSFSWQEMWEGRRWVLRQAIPVVLFCLVECFAALRFICL